MIASGFMGALMTAARNVVVSSENRQVTSSTLINKALAAIENADSDFFHFLLQALQSICLYNSLIILNCKDSEGWSIF